MKKLILALFIMASGSVANAQGSGFCLGPKIGFNSNTLTNNLDSYQSELNNSFQIGAFLRIGSKIYFQPEINYQLVSGTLNKSTASLVQSQDLNIQSVKIPALFGIKLINRNAVNLRVLAGPALTFMFDKQLKPSEMDELWPIQSVNDIKNSIWSVQMGAGLDLLFMTLDVRYEFGVENMYNGSSDFQMKQNTFNVSLGIKLL
jgi:hypothetical protein